MQKFVALPWVRYQELLEGKDAKIPSQEKQEKEQVGSGQSIPLSSDSILAAFPPDLHRDAEAILQQIERDPSIAWSRDGLLVVKGVIQQQVKLHDLLLDAVSSNTSAEPPAGGTIFYRVLSDINLPPALIKNPARRALLKPPVERTELQPKDNSIESPRPPATKPPGTLATTWLRWEN